MMNRRFCIERSSIGKTMLMVNEGGFEAVKERLSVDHLHSFRKDLGRGRLALRIYAPMLSRKDDEQTDRIASYYRTSDISVFEGLEGEAEYRTAKNSFLQLLVEVMQDKEHSIGSDYSAVLSLHPDINELVRRAWIIDDALWKMSQKPEMIAGTDAREIILAFEDAMAGIPSRNFLLESAVREFEKTLDRFRSVVQGCAKNIHADHDLMVAMEFVMQRFDMSEETTIPDTI